MLFFSRKMSHFAETRAQHRSWEMGNKTPVQAAPVGDS